MCPTVVSAKTSASYRTFPRYFDPHVFFDTRQHSAPHIHAEYADFRACFAIPSGEVLAGALPPRQARLVEQWIELRTGELLADWKLAVAGLPLQPIPPLNP